MLLNKHAQKEQHSYDAEQQKEPHTVVLMLNTHAQKEQHSYSMMLNVHVER